MSRRNLLTLVLGIGLCCGSPARAAITAFWQQVTITPEAITNDPALASMQSWDLMVTTTGNWASAGLNAALPAGSFFYKHPMGGFKPPSPGSVANHPALAFTTHVNTPNDNGVNNNNTGILGGFPDLQPSLGDPSAPQPGVFSVTWGDLFVDPPGTYQIARLTFPQNLLPAVHPNSFTLQVVPDASTSIPNIPEPVWAGLVTVSAALVVRRRSRLRHRAVPSAWETLEDRRLLSFSALFPGGATLTPRADTNASNSTTITEGEAVIAVSPSDPLKIAVYAVDGTNFDSDTIWISSNGGVDYTASTVPAPAGQTSGGDPAVAFDRAGNLYIAQLTNPNRNVSIAKLSASTQTWTALRIDNSAGGDKPWIITAPHPSNPSQDVVYLWWGHDNIRFMRSDDAGQSFYALPLPGGGDTPRMVARHDGKRLFASWWNRSLYDIRFNWGEYVGQPGQEQLVWHTEQVIDTSSVNFQIDASPGTNIVAAPSVAMDAIGRAFVTYTKKEPLAQQSDTDVWVAHKDNPTISGDWTLTRLRDGNTNSQFQSFVSTDPMTGVPYVSWLDTVNDPNNENVQRFMTVSLDGGDSWEAPTLVSDEDEVSQPYEPFSYGHYNGNTAFAGMGYDVWPSNAHLPSPGPLDIYTDHVMLEGHVITVTSTSADNIYHLQMDDVDNPQFVYIWENTDPTGTPTFMIHQDALEGLMFDLGDGIDVVFVTPHVIDYLSASGGFIDLGESRMIVDYIPQSSPLATIQALVTNGYNGGEWDGNGIRSSAAASAGNTGIGFAEAAEVLTFNNGIGVFSGHEVDETAVLLRYTGYGDTDLNGNVNLADFDQLAANFGTAIGARWFHGDFDFNGNVNLSDFDRLANNFGMTFGDDAEDPGNGFVDYTYEDLLEMLLGGG